MENVEQVQEAPVKPKKLVFLAVYLSAIPVFLTFLILFSLAIKYESNGYISRQAHKPQFQALPSDNNTSSISVESEDGRVEALDDFFASYGSPLEGHAKTIVEEADSHNIDYRLLPAIAMQESTLCKRIIKNSYNCWGFGIYGSKVTRFASYDDAIRTITETISKKYVQKGYVKPEEIVQKYTPGDTGKWPQVVNMMMDKIHQGL
jgi:hypothetical protein